MIEVPQRWDLFVAGRHLAGALYSAYEDWPEDFAGERHTSGLHVVRSGGALCIAGIVPLPLELRSGHRDHRLIAAALVPDSDFGLQIESHDFPFDNAPTACGNTCVALDIDADGAAIVPRTGEGRPISWETGGDQVLHAAQLLVASLSKASTRMDVLAAQGLEPAGRVLEGHDIHAPRIVDVLTAATQAGQP